MKPTSSNPIKFIGINLLVLLIILLGPGFAYYILTKLKPRSWDGSKYPVYESQEKAQEIYNEIKRTQGVHGQNKFEYYPFAEWRPTPSKGKYINHIKIGEFVIRKSTSNVYSNEINDAVWLFGGSTMWGWGVTDEESIPSIITQRSDIRTINFGVNGYNTRQNLNLLINLLAHGYKPKTVIFYDGINEMNSCRTLNRFSLTHNEERKFVERLQNTAEYNLFLKTARFASDPYTYITRKLKLNAPAIIDNYAITRSDYNCKLLPGKTSTIANNYLLNLSAASSITRKSGARFFAILQPTRYTSTSDVSYLPKADLAWRENTLVLYSKFKSLINKQCSTKKTITPICKEFIDGTKIINTKMPIFIDNSHVGKFGNALIAEFIIKQLNEK